MKDYTELTLEELNHFQEQWAPVVLPSDGDIELQEAARLQLQFAALSLELGKLVARAKFTVEQAKFSRNKNYHVAIMRDRGEKLSEKLRDSKARASEVVLIWEEKLYRAEALLTLTNNLYEAAIRNHYALRALFNDRSGEKWMT